MKKELKEKDIMLLETNKCGKFAVLPMNEFQKQSDLAIEELFRQFDGNLRQMKWQIVSIIKKNEFPFLVSKMNVTSRDTFGIKFFFKDHKVDLSLPIVVNKKGSWQKLVSSFRQKAPSVLDVGSP